MVTLVFSLPSDPYFAIEDDNKLVVASLINYQVTGLTLSLNVMATDLGGLTYQKTLFIVVQDVQDPADARTTTCDVDEDR